jgi:hypothetical protein
MRSTFVTFLVIGLLMLASSNLLQAQAVVEGKIIDARTGKPLQGAHVFLSDTKIGTVTKPSGHYQLAQIPPGAYRLVISMIGYDRTSIEIIFNAGETNRMDVELDPVVYEMDEIYVGDLDERWEKNLERFTRLFIGESERADSVEILNPEVLRFETRWWGRFSAEALAPLHIENRALGYRISYYLDEFSHTGTRTRWDGDPLFTEMTPQDSLQAAYWQQNRRKAFFGSLRHFLLALLEDNVKEEGFILHRIPHDVHGLSSRTRYRASARNLIHDEVDSPFFGLSFFGRLEITYTKAEENERYERWAARYALGIPIGSQTSYLELNQRPVTVDPSGEIVEPYGATQFGYFAYHRLADLTPREYRPEKYRIKSNER